LAAVVEYPKPLVAVTFFIVSGGPFGLTLLVATSLVYFLLVTDWARPTG
jgi:hypothetical protein